MPTDRLNILATAVALREFTVPQLAAFSGANPHNVRQVVKRERDRGVLRQLDRTEASAGRGRHAAVWEVSHPAAVLDEIAAEEASLDGLQRSARAVGAEEPSPDDEEEAEMFLTSAEEALARSLEADDTGSQKRLAETALNFLRAAEVRSPFDPESTRFLGMVLPVNMPGTDAMSPMQARARGVAAFADLAMRRATHQPIETAHLRRAAEALVAGRGVLPAVTTNAWLRHLVSVATETGDHVPPVGVITPPRRSAPVDLFPTTNKRQWGFRRYDAGRVKYRLWYEHWAESLVSHGLMPACVVSHDGKLDSTQILNEVLESLAEDVETEHPATVVASSADDTNADLATRVFASGAMYYPMKGHVDRFMPTVGRAAIQAVTPPPLRWAGGLQEGQTGTGLGVSSGT